MSGWSGMSGVLINVIFATVFIGIETPAVKDIWDKGSPQLMFGQVITMGQYTIGCITGLSLMFSGFDITPYFGVIFPVGYEGGHGTAAAFKDGFTLMGWSSGFDLALMSATVGLVGGVLMGTVCVNVLRI